MYNGNKQERHKINPDSNNKRRINSMLKKVKEPQHDKIREELITAILSGQYTPKLIYDLSKRRINSMLKKVRERAE